MDFLKNQAMRIREQLAGLTQSQKMLAAALVVIMTMSLVWWSKFAGASEMEALMDQDFPADVISRASAQIASRGIAYKVVGNRIHVAADRKFEVIAMLAYEQMLPGDTSSGFESIIEKMDTPFGTDKRQDVAFNHAKEVALQQIIRGFPGVRNATVVIDNKHKRSFGEANLTPSATVSIQTRDGGGKAPKKMIDAAADTVVGAVSGLARDKISVVIDGASHKVHARDGDGGAADGWMEIVKEAEQYYSSKVMDHFRWIDGVMVSVTVDPQLSSRQKETQQYDKANTIEKTIESSEKSEENNTTSKGSAEPGTVANTGASIGAAGGGGGDSSVNSKTDTLTKSQIFPSLTREWIKTPAGARAVAGASVSVPRSHFTKIFKIKYPTEKEPTDAALLPLIQEELGRIRPVVKACFSQTADEKVDVGWYYDYTPSIAAGTVTAAASSVPLALTSHMKEIALGLLAVISLFMVSSMVKKGAPEPILPPPARKQPKPQPPVVLGSEPVAGEAGEGAPSMEAVEVDDESIRTSQMVTQVSTMVKENPDAAANLVKRWLNRE